MDDSVSGRMSPFNRHGLGTAAPELGVVLAVYDLRTPDLRSPAPLVNASDATGDLPGVECSPGVDVPARLQARGTQGIACRTCLDFLGLTEQVVAGEIGTMVQIVEPQAAARVISV